MLSFLVTGLLLRRVPRWRRFGSGLLLGSPLTLALLVLYFLTFSPTAAGAIVFQVRLLTMKGVAHKSLV